MTRQGLEQVLAELNAQLDSTTDLSPEQYARLRGAAEEIQAALERREVPDHEEEYSGTISQRWDDATRSFTESHPVLASSIGRIADLLSQIGI